MLFKVLRRTLETASSSLYTYYDSDHRVTNPQLSMGGLLHMIHAKDQLIKEMKYKKTPQARGLKVKT